MRKKGNYRSFAVFRSRMPKVFIVMMLAFMMTVSGIAPSFCVFAEDISEEAVMQIEEVTAPASQEAAEVVKEEPPAPAPEPEPEPVKEESEPDAEVLADNDVQSGGNTDGSNEKNNDAVNKEVPGATGTTTENDVSVPADNVPAVDDEKTEEEKYPAQGFSASTADLDISVSAAEGVFPEGTKMKARSASSAEVMDAAQSLAGEGSEIVDAAAADITFHHDGSEIQPKGSVSVKLSAKRALAGDSYDAVTVSDSGNASVVSDASASSASFNTDHFTVYGIIGTDYEDDIDKNVRYTYIFHLDNDNDANVSEQIVKRGEKVILPEAEDNENFRWVDRETGDEITNKTMVPADAAEDKTIHAVKRFGRCHVIFYTDDSAGTVCRTVESMGDPVKLITKEEFEEMGLVPNGVSFAGWKNYETDEAVTGEKVTTEGKDIHLVPVFKDDLEVTLDANGGEFKRAGDAEAAGSPSVTLTVKYGGKVEIKETPVRKGYTFKDPAWYVNPQATDAWDPENVVTEEMTLYAGWEVAENSFILSVMRENAQNDAYSEKEHKEWTSNNGTALKTGDPIPVSAILAQYGKDKYKSDHYHLNGTGAKQDNAKFKDSCPAIVVYHGGSRVAAFDCNGSCVEGDAAKAVIADKDTVVKVYYSLDSYQLYFRFDPKLSKYNNPVNGVDGGTQLAREKNPVAYDDYYNLMGTDSIAYQSEQVLKYGEWMYAKAYGNNPRIAKLLDEGTHWWFEAVYRGTYGQQTVFNASNMYNAFRPAEGTPDGQGVLILVKYNADQRMHQIIDIYYDAEGKVVTKKPPITINYKTPRKHEFKLGSVADGYELVKVTGPLDSSTNEYRELQAELQSSGQTKFTYLYKDGEPLPMICHWHPVEYTITYVQMKTGAVDIKEACKENDQQYKVLFAESTRTAYEARPSGGSWDKIYDKNGIEYTFEGIEVYTQAGKKLDSIPDTMPNSNLIVFYRWTPEKFKVVYDPDNGDQVRTDADIPAYGRTKGYENLRKAELTKEGFEFRGWYVTDEKGEPAGLFDFSTEILKDYYLKAVWVQKNVYQVRYDANGGILPEEGLDKDGMDLKTFRGGSEAKIAGSAKPNDDNSRFIGWAVGSESGGIITGSSFMVNSDNDKLDGDEDHVITLVAKYETYKQMTSVVYHTNYPAGEKENGKTFEETDVTVNSAFKVLAINGIKGWSDTYTYEGTTYKFVCWTNAGGENIYLGSEGRDYFFPNELAAAGRWENDLYAVWKEVPEVKNSVVGPSGTGGTEAGVLGAYQDDTKTAKAKAKGVKAASEGVATGDTNAMAGLIALMTLAAAGIALILIRRSRDLNK